MSESVVVSVYHKLPDGDFVQVGALEGIPGNASTEAALEVALEYATCIPHAGRVLQAGDKLVCRDRHFIYKGTRRRVREAS